MASYIPGLVIEKNDNVFINSATSIGSVMEIPTPDNYGFLDGDFWAVPINYGTYSGFNFIPYNPANPAENVAPNVMSVACCKISSTQSSDWYMVLGTSAAYVTAAGGGAALAVVWPTRSHTIPLLPTCQDMNQTDANGKYIAVMSLPSLNDFDVTTDLTWFPYGNFNGVALPGATANGYASTATLLTFLNTATVNSGTTDNPVYTGGWGIVGTWTVTGDSISLIATQTAGPGTDVLCATVVVISRSA